MPSTSRLVKWFELPKGRDAGARRGDLGGGRERAEAKMDKVSSNPLQPRHRGSPENFQINEAIFFGITSRYQRRAHPPDRIIFHHVASFVIPIFNPIIDVLLLTFLCNSLVPWNN